MAPLAIGALVMGAVLVLVALSLYGVLPMPQWVRDAYNRGQMRQTLSEVDEALAELDAAAADA